MEILIVCSGNICRSPYAEGYLRHRLDHAAVQGVSISSAGTLGIVGSPPSPETQALAREAGFDVAAHRSNALHYDRIDDADTILVMEEAHRLQLLARYPEEIAKVRLLSSYHPAARDLATPPDIFDPIGLPISEYRRCFELLRESLDGFADEVLHARG